MKTGSMMTALSTPISTLVSLSLKNVRRYARKSIASLVIMTVAVLALNVLGGYVDGNLEVLKNAFVRWGARGHLVIEKPRSDMARTVEAAGQIPITADEQKRIDGLLAADAQVATASRMLRVSGALDASGVSTVFSGVGWDVDATRAIKGPAYEYDVVAGAPLWQAKEPGQVVLGQGLARILGCRVPDVGFAPLRPGEKPARREFACPAGPIQLTVPSLEDERIGAARVGVAGVMDWGIKEVNDRLVVMDLPAAQRLLNTGSISEYHVLLKDGANEDAVKERIGAALKAAGIAAEVSKWSDRATFYHQVKGMMLSFLGFVLTVSLIVGYMSLLNSSYMNFIQRTREFATLRSMGYSRRFVSALTALENIWLALLAAGFGVAGAAGIAWAVRAGGLSWTPPGSTNAVPIEIAVLPGVYLMSGMVLGALAAVASAIPTRKILRRPIVESLHAT
jgi:putative ABC transport system permease protein